MDKISFNHASNPGGGAQIGKRTASFEQVRRIYLFLTLWKKTLSDNFIGKLYVWDYQLLIIGRIRWEEDLSGLQRHQWDHGEAEKLMFYENPLWKINIFISNSGNSMNRISCTLCNAQGYFYPRFEAIYPSQRHNWPPTLEIMPRNFPKSWHLQNFQNIQNFQFFP